MKLQKLFLVTALFIIQFLPRRMLFVLVLFFWGSLHSVTWEVNQDGSGDYQEIQTAINASTHGDTVLVYPGRYFENVDFLEKNITLSSLYLINPVDSLIAQTVIDGNHNGSAVRIEEADDAVLNGFTIEHGSGDIFITSYTGGGVLIMNCNAIIQNCVVQYNTADAGGGIAARTNHESDMVVHPTLAGNTIRYNHAYEAGGGYLCGTSYAQTEFDQENLCNIYLNTASQGNDIALFSNDVSYDVFVDTFTVMIPDNHFFYAINHNNDEPFGISIQNSKINPVNSDLYVRPVGNDNNSGLSPAEPLKTIGRALIKVQPDSLNPVTIHVAPGVYSETTNGEFFPLSQRSFVNIAGAGAEQTILNANFRSGIFSDNQKRGLDYTLEKMGMKNVRPNKYAIIISRGRNVRLNNLRFDNNGQQTSGFIQHYNAAIFVNPYVEFYDDMHLYVDSLSIENISNARAFQPQYFQRGIIDKLSIRNHHFIDSGPDSYGATNIALSIQDGYGDNFGQSYFRLTNCLVANNTLASNWPGSYTHPTAINIVHFQDVDIINCTFTNNEIVDSYYVGEEIGRAIAVWDGSNNVNIINTISYGNEDYQLALNVGSPLAINSVVRVKNSLIGDYYVGDYDSFDFVFSDDCLLDVDPLFDAEAENPYYLSEDSPCIDSGTLVLPDGIELPDTDLAGNLRVQGNGIDMGCYESPYSVSNETETVFAIQTKIVNYPNPFNPSTTISFTIPEPQRVVLEIFNIKGQKVKTLLNSFIGTPTYSVQWHGTDDNGKPVSSGQYFAKLKFGEDVIAKKLLLLK